MLLQSIYAIGVCLLELPTGAFADFFGKKWSLMLGAIFLSGGLVWYGLSSQFWQFVIGELLAGIGSAFISGADRAYIFGLLSLEHKENDFKKTEGRARGIIQVAQAIGSMGGGFIGSISLGFTLIATGFAAFASFIVGSTFPSIKSPHLEEKKIPYFHIIRDSFSLMKKQKRLLWLTLFFACFNGLLWPLNLYSQPFLEMLHIPILFFGFIFFVFNLISAVGSSLTHRFEVLTQKAVFGVICFITVSSLFIIAVTKSIYTFPLWSLFVTLMFMNQTIISDEVLKIIPAGKAATILSLQSLVKRFVYALIGPFLGITTDIFGIQKALIGYTFFLAFVFGVVLLVEKKFRTVN